MLANQKQESLAIGAREHEVSPCLSFVFSDVRLQATKDQLVLQHVLTSTDRLRVLGSRTSALCAADASVKLPFSRSMRGGRLEADVEIWFSVLVG